ncbi:MAG: AAA family ATPase [Phenylobacterium sp.]|uniref:AAA family ATPase n=1 Tax=Phenylobacterium sp. TaxID=1871053 RepID=UPI001A5999E1|nr:AAA family ATPase [Phenylobacterium sp.]MBL8773357.1 AAA family ATPase [Phenylobacterium sp.]
MAAGDLSRPSGIGRSYIPLNLICGPPGAGKSAYVRAHAQPRDLVLCFDELARQMFGRGRAAPERVGATLTDKQVFAVLEERNRLLADLARPDTSLRWRWAWLIALEPIAEHREWWARTMGARVFVLPTPADECLRRIQADTTAGDDRGPRAADLVRSWWSTYRPAACDREAT